MGYPVKVKGSQDLQCTVTPKVYLMREHVEWQMTNKGGLGDTMEDWVKRLPQTGKCQRLRYCGWFEVMKYFKQDDVKLLTWLVPIFNVSKGKEGGVNADGTKYLSRLEKELT